MNKWGLIVIKHDAELIETGIDYIIVVCKYPLKTPSSKINREMVQHGPEPNFYSICVQCTIKLLLTGLFTISTLTKNSIMTFIKFVEL